MSSKALYENKIKQFGLKDKFIIQRDLIECKPTGSLFQFVGLDRNPDSIRSLEGATLTIFEEAQNLAAYAIQTAEPTVMRHARSRMIFNWNPINKDDAVDMKFRGPNPPDDAYIQKITWRDNPYFFKTNLPEQMRHMKRTNYSLYRHVWEGDYFGGMERRIFNNWEKGLIEVPEHIMPQYGLDFGSTDPNAIVKLYVNHKERWIYVAREFCAPGDTNTVLMGLNEVVEKKTDKIVCDSAWPQSIAVVQKEYPRAVAAKKGKNSVIEGIKWLQGFKIYIHPACKKMLYEAENYSWQIDKHKVNEDGSPVTLDAPEDADNHLWDAVRYATEDARIKNNSPVRVSRLVF